MIGVDSDTQTREMLSSPRTRLVAVAILLAVLAGLFIWAGTIEPDPADNNYPSTSNL